MFVNAKVAAIAALFFVAVVSLQGVTAQETSQTPLRAKLAAELRANAEQLNRASFSRLFTAIADPNLRADLGLTNGQVALCQRMEGLTRRILQSLLLDGLDTSPLATPGELVDRLSERRVQVRESIVAHAEAIILEGVLTRTQAQRWQTSAHQKTDSLRVGRSRSESAKLNTDNMTPAEMTVQLQWRSTALQRAGDAMFIILGGSGSKPKVKISSQQQDIVLQLNKLTIAVYQAWLTAGLNTNRPPRHSELAERLGERGDRVKESLFSHAESIAFRGVLTPDQVERTLRAIWELKGTRAILDPEMASRLRLTRSQRSEALAMLETKATLLKELSCNSPDFMRFYFAHPELQEQLDEVGAQERQRAEDVDSLIRELLTPSQLRALQRLTGVETTSAGRSPTKSRKGVRPD